MTTNPVESSMISRVGYDPDTQLLRAVMRDGTAYDCAPVSEAKYAAFMVSPSKGNHWHHNFADSAWRSLIRGTGEPLVPTIQLQEPLPSGPLETFAEDVCCAPRLQRAQRTEDKWTCPKCGSTWKAVQVGALKHWSPEPHFFVIHTGRM